MRKRYVVTLSMLLATSQANAVTMPVSEPNTISLLGLGAVVAVLVVRYLRRCLQCKRYQRRTYNEKALCRNPVDAAGHIPG